ncbi:MAG: hypothetical protein RLZZ169_579 [Pseudomonadota bacterium]|jgi:hypothetical protein
MDEEEMTDETAGALGAVSGIDFKKLQSDPMGLLQSVYSQQQQAEQAREATAKRMYDEAAKRIAERNAGMSQSEQLLAISQALLAPRKYRGIAGTIGKLSGAFSGIAETDRKARLAREAELEKLRTSYEEGVADRGVARAKTAADLVKTAGSLTKVRTGFNPVTGQLVDMDSGAPIGAAGAAAPAASKVGTMETRGGVEGYYNEKGVWTPLPARPEKTTWRAATPEEAAMYGATSGQISSTGEFKPGKAAGPRQYKPVEVKMITEAEDIIGGAEETLRGLNRALELNSTAYEGSLTGIRKQVGSLFSSDDPAYVAAEELDNVLANIALGKLKTTFPGSITEGERKILMDLQGSSSQPRKVRERIIRNAIPVIQRIVQRNKQRLNKIQSGGYASPTAPSAPAAGTRVIRYDKQGRRI